MYRDARIGPVFEGTNFIQSQDLLGRKILRDGAAALAELLEQVEASAQRLPDEATLRNALRSESHELRAYVQQLLATPGAQAQAIATIAYPFLQWLGVIAGGW